jgi:hypothetical protein
MGCLFFKVCRSNAYLEVQRNKVLDTLEVLQDTSILLQDYIYFQCPNAPTIQNVFVSIS